MTTIRPPGLRTDGFAAPRAFAWKMPWERLARGRTSPLPDSTSRLWRSASMNEANPMKNESLEEPV